MSNFVGRGIVNVGWLNMRASQGGAVLDILKEGTELYLLGRTGGWLEVMLNGVRGYVASRYIRVTPTTSPETPKKVKGTETKNAKDKGSKATTTRYGEITAGRLNFRDTPNGHILRTLIKGDVVEILGQESGWTHINSKGKTGYVSSKYIRVGKVKTQKKKFAYHLLSAFALKRIKPLRLMELSLAKNFVEAFLIMVQHLLATS